MKKILVFILLAITVFGINSIIQIQSGTTVVFQESYDLIGGDMDYWKADLIERKDYYFSWSSEYNADLLCLDSFNFDRYNSGFVGDYQVTIVYISQLSKINGKSLSYSFSLQSNTTYYFAVENSDYLDIGAPEVAVTEINISLSYSWTDPTTNGEDTTTNGTNLNFVSLTILILIMAHIRRKHKKIKD